MLKIANIWRKIAGFYQLSNRDENSIFYNLFILALFTACFYHFLFLRYLNSSITRFLSDTLLPFPNRVIWIAVIYCCFGNYSYISHSYNFKASHKGKWKCMENAWNFITEKTFISYSLGATRNSICSRKNIIRHFVFTPTLLPFQERHENIYENFLPLIQFSQHANWLLCLLLACLLWSLYNWKVH